MNQKIFGINKDDIRGLFLLYILTNLTERNLELNSINLYASPYMLHIRNNREWITYCMDLCKEDTIIILHDNNILFPNFFRQLAPNTFQRLANKLSQLTNIIPSTNYNISNETMFQFDDTIFNSILKGLLLSIPEMKQIEIDIINPIQQCVRKKSNTFNDIIKKCTSSSNTNKCKQFMSSTNFLDTIILEIQEMHICDATNILMDFGFKYNTTFESYEDWEKRTIDILRIPSINPYLVQYIKLLLKRVNVIEHIKQLISNKCNSISNILLRYGKLHPKFNDIISQYNKLDEKQYMSKYIVDKYNDMINIFNNKKFFNYDNLYIYKNYYKHINQKYMITQETLFDKIKNII